MGKLLERSGELAAFGTALEAALGGSGSCVVVDGVAGIGKTALLTAAARRARARGLRVWQAAGSELERDFPFGVARALLAPAIEHGAPVALRDDSGPAVPEGDQAGAVAAVRRLVADAARGGPAPLLLVVDDVHWADAASLRCLVAIARSLAELPLILLVAGRPSDQLRSLRRGDGAVALGPRPLSPEATAALVRAFAPAASEDVCRACHSATGGTPLYVREVARGLEAHGLDAGPGAAGRVLAWSPEQLTQAVGDRLAALSPEARAQAQALAVLDAGASAYEVGLLAAVDADARARAGDALRGVGILDDDRGLAFAHPVLRAATAATLLPGAADRLHRRAAALLARQGAGAQRVAAQVMACEPAGDADACAWLLASAAEALTRRAPEVAVRQLRRALAEPPPEPGLRLRVLVALGIAESRSLEQDAAVAHLQEAVALARDPLERLDAALSLAAAVSHRSGDTAPLIADLLARLAELDDPALVAQVEAQLVLQGLFGTASRRATAALGARVLERVGAAGDRSAAEQSVAAIELAISACDAPRVAALAQAALAAGEPHPALRGTTLVTAVRCLAAADALDAADAILAGEPEREAATYDEHYLAWFRADVLLRRGALSQARRLAHAAWEAACAHDWPMMRDAASGLVADICAETGEHALGARVLAGGGCDGPAAELPDQYTTIMLLVGRGRLRLAAGDAALGLEDLLDCGRRMREFGERNPALIGWWAPAALALGGDRGRALAAEARELAQGFGAARALGIAQRACALLEDDPFARGRGLEAARATLAASPARLEHARVTADLGRHAYATGDPATARDLLLEAYEQAHRCGATALEREATAALHALGARPRSPFTRGPEALTARERSVTERAAGGATNREIAADLVVTVGTVEFHLSRAFAKLGVRSRTELPEALGVAEPRTV